MSKTKLCALLFAVVLAGASIVPVATCAAKGEVGEPPLPPDDSGDIGEPPLPGDDDSGETGEPPLPGEDNPGDEDTTKPVDYDVLFEEAKDSIANRDKTAALKAAINAVDEQIPNWNIWKYVPYAMKQVEEGWVLCGGINNGYGVDEKGILMDCRASVGGGKSGIISKLVPQNEDDTMESYEERPEVQRLAKMSLPWLIAYAKTQPQYETDESLQENVATAEQAYNYGVIYLREALEELAKSEATNVETMDGEALIAKIKSLDEYKLYKESSLFSDYGWAYGGLYVFNDDADALSSYYANLVVAATKVNPEFSVDLAGVPVITPSAPNTGSAGSEAASGVLAKVALTTIAVVTFVAGALITAKRYAFSPLKRK